MYKNYFKYSQEIYLVNLEEGYCTFSFNDHHQKVYADPTILQELQRSQWKEEKRNKRFYTSTYSYNNEDENGITFFEHLPDPSSVTPDIYVENKDISEMFKNALDMLSKKQKTIITLYYFFKHTEKEIANMIGSNTKTVHYHKQSALKKLAQNEKLKDLYENDF